MLNLTIIVVLLKIHIASVTKQLNAGWALPISFQQLDLKKRKYLGWQFSCSSIEHLIFFTFSLEVYLLLVSIIIFFNSNNSLIQMFSSFQIFVQRWDYSSYHYHFGNTAFKLLAFTELSCLNYFKIILRIGKR